MSADRSMTSAQSVATCEDLSMHDRAWNISRRGFLKLSAAALFAGLYGRYGSLAAAPGAAPDRKSVV